MAAHFLLYKLALAGYLISYLLLVLHFFVSWQRTAIFARLLLTAATIVHLLSLALRSIEAGHAPVANFFESLNQFMILIAIVTAWQLWRYRDTFSAIFPLSVLLITGYFSFRINPRITELYPALQSIWFELHVISAFFSYALFTMGASLSIFYFLRRNNKIEYINRRVPPYLSLDKIAYRQNAWGFFWFTFSMFTGGIWAYYAWGNYWIWTAKELWSTALWLFYAVYIHAGFTPRWAGRRANALSIIGFGVMLFTFLGVNLMLRSSHRF